LQQATARQLQPARAHEQAGASRFERRLEKSRYLRLTITDLKEAHTRFHPRG
jgi:hypothetical protein